MSEMLVALIFAGFDLYLIQPSCGIVTLLKISPYSWPRYYVNSLNQKNHNQHEANTNSFTIFDST